MMRLVAGKLAGGFGAWREMASVRKAMLLLAGRCARRMRNAGLYGGWSAWRAMAAEARGQARTMGGALRRMMMRQLSMAFEKWQFEAAEMARSKYMMGGALNRLLKRQLSMAWEKWQYEAAEMKMEVLEARREVLGERHASSHVDPPAGRAKIHGVGPVAIGGVEPGPEVLAQVSRNACGAKNLDRFCAICPSEAAKQL